MSDLTWVGLVTKSKIGKILHLIRHPDFWDTTEIRLTSLPLVIVRRQRCATQWKSARYQFTWRKLHSPSAKPMLRQMHFTDVSEAKYRFPWPRFDVNKRKNQLWKLNPWICHFVQESMTQIRGDRRENKRISAVSISEPAHCNMNRDGNKASLWSRSHALKRTWFGRIPRKKVFTSRPLVSVRRHGRV